jgi:hypothetical protein
VQRFFAVLFSGTRTKTRRRSGNGAPDADIQRTSPSSWRSHPRTALQNSATRRRLLQSKFNSQTAAPMERRYCDVPSAHVRDDPRPLSRRGPPPCSLPAFPCAYRGLSRSRYQ